jgi:predicted HTH domain antitoxin
MSTLHIPDDVLRLAGLSEQDALIELACRLFETGKLTLFFSAKLAGLSTADFEDLLLDRGIPLYRYTAEDLKIDLASFAKEDKCI